MDGVSSAFAVVSLAIQLVSTIQEINKFLEGVENAPSELTNLVEILDRLRGILTHVQSLLEQQNLILRVPVSPQIILDALVHCKKKIDPLEQLVKKLRQSGSDRRRVQRSWASIRFVCHKERIKDLKDGIRDAKIDLQLAISSNTWQLHIHQLDTRNQRLVTSTTLEDQHKPNDSPFNFEIKHDQLSKSSISKFRSRVATRDHQSSVTWYEGVLGSIHAHTMSKDTSQLLTGGKDRSRYAITKHQVIFTPSFWNYSFVVDIKNYYGRVTRSLSSYPVISWRHMLLLNKHKDVQAFQIALTTRSMSPFVIDEGGRSLLHLAALFRPDLCTWFLQLGLDPNRPTNYGIKPLQYASNIETFTLLAQAQEEMSLSDVVGFMGNCEGSPQDLELLYQQCYKCSLSPDQGSPFLEAHALAAALAGCGRGVYHWDEWDGLIRKFLRKRIDIYGRLPSTNKPIIGTPLDELFRYTQTPFEARSIADAWLDILSDEGYDVVAYLHREMKEHSAPLHQTCNHRISEMPRYLVFEVDGHPSVTWDWCIIRDSSALLLFDEYIQMIGLTDATPGYFDYRGHWPIVYPEWYKDLWWDCADLLRSERLNDLAQRRANRRERNKASKKARAQGLKAPDTMPGTWLP